MECVDALRQSVQFKQQCENAYETLKSVLGVCIETTKSIDAGNVIETIDTVESDSNDHLHTDTRIEPVICGPNEKCIQTEDICFYPCEMCELKFFKEEALKEHRLKEHRNKETGFKCRNCDRNYTRLSHLRRHINVAHPEVNISGKLNDIYCKECDRHFTRHEHLRRHMMVLHQEQGVKSNSKMVNAEEVVKCGGCGETFENQQSFDQHDDCEAKTA